MTVAYISTSLGSMNVSTPWAGVVGNSHRVNSGPSVADTYLNQKSEIRAHVSVLHVTGSQSDSVDDGNFIDAKESKKSRKKAAKAPNASNKHQIFVLCFHNRYQQ